MPLVNPSTAGLSSAMEAQLYPFVPANSILNTIPERVFTLANLAGTLAGGRIHLVGAQPKLLAGQTVSSISFMSGSQAAVGPTNQWFALVDQSYNVLAKTVDDTTTAWAADTVKTLSLSSPYTASADIAVYLAIVVTVTTTLPNFRGVTLSGVTAASNVSPLITLSGQSSLTNPASLGATVTSIAAHSMIPWAWAS